MIIDSYIDEGAITKRIKAIEEQAQTIKKIWLELKNYIPEWLSLDFIREYGEGIKFKTFCRQQYIKELQAIGGELADVEESERLKFKYSELIAINNNQKSYCERLINDLYSALCSCPLSWETDKNKNLKSDFIKAREKVVDECTIQYDKERYTAFLGVIRALQKAYSDYMAFQRNNNPDFVYDCNAKIPYITANGEYCDLSFCELLTASEEMQEKIFLKGGNRLFDCI